MRLSLSLNCYPGLKIHDESTLKNGNFVNQNTILDSHHQIFKSFKGVLGDFFVKNSPSASPRSPNTPLPATSLLLLLLGSRRCLLLLRSCRSSRIRLLLLRLLCRWIA